MSKNGASAVVSLEKMAAQLNNLSISDLLALQNLITDNLQSRLNDLTLTSTHRPTQAELEADDDEFFGPVRNAELKAFIKAGGLNNLPALPKSLSEYIIEDREDRFI